MSKGAIVLSAVPNVVGGTLGQQVEHYQNRNIIIYCGSGTAGGFSAITNMANISHMHGLPTVLGAVSITSHSNAWTISVPDFITTAALPYHDHGPVDIIPIVGSNMTLSSASNGLTIGMPQFITTAPALTHTHDYAGTGTTITGGFMTLDSNGLALNITGGGGAADGYNIIAAGTQTADTVGTVMFSNSHGISFGMSGGSRITASYTQSTHDHPYIHSSLSNIFLTDLQDAIGTQTAESNVTWTADSRGISLDARGYAGTMTSATNVGLSVDSRGISVSLDTAGLTSFGDGVNILAAGSVTAGSLQTVLFNDANGISFGMDTDSTAITARHNAYSATSMFSASFLNTGEPHIQQMVVSDSTYTSGSVILSGSNNVTVSYNSDTIFISGPGTHDIQTGISGIIVSDTTFTSGSVSFKNTNSISFGSDGENILTASIAFPSQSQQPVWYSASGEAFSSNTLEFNPAGGVSFYLTNGSVAGSVRTDYLDSQSHQEIAISDSLASFTFDTLSLGAENGLTLYLSDSSLVGSYTVPTLTDVSRVISFNEASGELSLSVSRNLTLSPLNGSTYSLYGPANIINSFSVSGNRTTSNSSNITGGGFILAGGNNITLSQHNNSISIIGTGGIRLGASNTTYDTGIVHISAGSNVTVGTTENAGIQYIRIDANLSGDTAYDGYNIIAAGSETAGTATTVLFSDSNGVSFGLSGNILTASIDDYAGTGITTGTITGTNINITAGSNGINFVYPSLLTSALQTAIQGIIVSDATFSEGSVSFKNSNNVSFGSDGSNIVTVSFHNVMSYSVQGTQTSGSILEFANTNGVSFSLTGDVVGATVRTDYMSSQSSSVFARTGFTSTTTAGSLINATLDTLGLRIGVPSFITNTLGAAGTGFTSVSQAGSNISGFLNSGGLGLLIPPYLTTAMQSACTSVLARTGFSSTTTAGIDIGGTLNTSGLSLAIPRYLTTAMPFQSSTRFIGTATAQTNVTWTVDSRGISFNAGNYARTGATTASTTGSDIKVTLNTGGLYMGIPNFGTGVGGGAGTGITTNTITGTRITGTLNSAGLSMLVPRYITTGLAASDIADVVFVDSLGTNLTWGSSLGTGASSRTTYIYASAGGGGAAVASWQLAGTRTAGTTSRSFDRLYLEGYNNITLSGSSNTIRLSVANAAGQSYQPMAFSGSNGSSNASTITFGNLNGLSHYISNGSLVGSYTVPTQTSQPRVVSLNGSSGSMSISALNTAVTISNNNSTIGISVRTYPAQSQQPMYYSANVSSTSNILRFSNTHNVSFSLSNGQVVASAAPSGLRAIGNTVNSSAFTSGSVMLSGANITVNTSTASGGRQYLQISAPQIGYLYFSNSHITWGSSINGLSTSIYAVTA